MTVEIDHTQIERTIERAKKLSEMIQSIREEARSLADEVASLPFEITLD